MKINSKGEGGFMESMAAVAVVVISLTAFLSFLAFSVSHDTEEKENELPLYILDDVRIANGDIEADIEDKMNTAIERYGYTGMRVTLTADDGTICSAVTLNAGHQDSDVIRSRTGTIIIAADNGRSVPVNYAMAVWS